MRVFSVSPPEKWWRLLCEKGVVVYFRLPIESVRGWVDGDSDKAHSVLIRGSVVSMKRTPFGATVVAIRVHAGCRLYQEPILPRDEIIKIDLYRIVGIDHREAMLLPCLL